MSERMTQKERILKWLRDAGDEGVTGSELYGAFMPRFSARILELRDAGHEIDSVPIGDSQFRYVLKVEATPARTIAELRVAEAPADEPSALFQVPDEPRPGRYIDHDQQDAA